MCHNRMVEATYSSLVMTHLERRDEVDRLCAGFYWSSPQLTSKRPTSWLRVFGAMLDTI